MTNQSIWKKNVGHLINATENFAKGNIGIKNYRAFIKMISADFSSIDFKYEKVKSIYNMNFVFKFDSAFPIIINLEVDTNNNKVLVSEIQQ